MGFGAEFGQSGQLGLNCCCPDRGGVRSESMIFRTPSFAALSLSLFMDRYTCISCYLLVILSMSSADSKRNLPGD